MVRESILLDTWKATRVGIFALINPVMTSTEGRWVATTKWIPHALAFCARRAMGSSTFLPTTIIKSANSSITMTINGNSSSGSGLSGVKVKGWGIGLPSFTASRTLTLYPARLRTPSADISLYRRSISATPQLRAFPAWRISVITGANRCGIPSYTESSSILGSIKIMRTLVASAL